MSAYACISLFRYCIPLCPSQLIPVRTALNSKLHISWHLWRVNIRLNVPNNLFTVLPPFSVVDEWPLKRGLIIIFFFSVVPEKKILKGKNLEKKIARALAPVLSLLHYTRFPVGTQRMPYFNRFNRCRIFVGEGVAYIQRFQVVSPLCMVLERSGSYSVF